MNKGTSCRWKVPTLHPLQKAPWTDLTPRSQCTVMHGDVTNVTYSLGLKGLKGTWCLGRWWWSEGFWWKQPSSNLFKFIFMESRKKLGWSRPWSPFSSVLKLPGYQKAGNSEEANQMIRKAYLLVDQGGWYMGKSLCLPLFSLFFFIRLPRWPGILWIQDEIQSNTFDREHYLQNWLAMYSFTPAFQRLLSFQTPYLPDFTDHVAEWKFSTSCEQYLWAISWYQIMR